jgi:hypothetical protein
LKFQDCDNPKKVATAWCLFGIPTGAIAGPEVNLCEQELRRLGVCKDFVSVAGVKIKTEKSQYCDVLRQRIEEANNDRTLLEKNNCGS